MNADEQRTHRTVTQALDARLATVEALIPRLSENGDYLKQESDTHGRTIAMNRDDLEHLVMHHLEMTTHAAERFNSVIHGSFLVRLRWLLRGTVPWCVERDRQFASVAGSQTIAQGSGPH